MSNLGKWTRWYDLLDGEPLPYGDSVTYEIGADYLAGLHVEDWGCGMGWFRQFIPPRLYRGVDGSAGPFADVVADLAEYRSTVEGVYLRHVLEHDYRWRDILSNAAASASKRLVVVLFTPLADETREIAWNEDPGVPDQSFALADLLAELSEFDVEVRTVADSPTQYGVETVLLAERN